MKRQILIGLALGLLAGAGVAAVPYLFAALQSQIGAIGIDGTLPWYTTRAAAITAYLLLSATTMLGLTITAKGPNRWLSRASVFALHEYLSWLALGFVGLHVGSLLVDTFQPFNPLDVLVPFASAYRTVAVGLGTISLYLMAVLVSSFYLRARIGQKTWRAIHFSSFLLYVIATLHGITAGSSSTQPWMQALYLLSGGAVLILLAYRIAKSRTTASRRQEAGRNAVPGRYTAGAAS